MALTKPDCGGCFAVTGEMPAAEGQQTSITVYQSNQGRNGRAQPGETAGKQPTIERASSQPDRELTSVPRLCSHLNLCLREYPRARWEEGPQSSVMLTVNASSGRVDQDSGARRSAVCNWPAAAPSGAWIRALGGTRAWRGLSAALPSEQEEVRVSKTSKPPMS
jgi:hypothetical protein